MEIDNNKEMELRTLDNFIWHMPKVYRLRHMNYSVVHDILMQGTSTSGMTSCINKCVDLGIKPYDYKF